MGIKADKGWKKDFRDAQEKALKEIETTIFDILSVIGENAYTLAKDGGSYTDRSGNLRSSVGYIISINGEIKNMFFVGSGAAEGERFAIEKINEIDSKYVLLIVAGMNYASYVENKAYDVLLFTKTMAEAKAIELFEQVLI